MKKHECKLIVYSMHPKTDPLEIEVRMAELAQALDAGYVIHNRLSNALADTTLVESILLIRSVEMGDSA